MVSAADMATPIPPRRSDRTSGSSSRTHNDLSARRRRSAAHSARCPSRKSTPKEAGLCAPHNSKEPMANKAISIHSSLPSLSLASTANGLGALSPTASPATIDTTGRQLLPRETPNLRAVRWRPTRLWFAPACRPVRPVQSSRPIRWPSAPHPPGLARNSSAQGETGSAPSCDHASIRVAGRASS